MRSKSSKRKMRLNCLFYNFVKLIEVKLIDNRNGIRLFLITIRDDKVTKSVFCRHYEVYGQHNVVKKYREILQEWKSKQK